MAVATDPAGRTVRAGWLERAVRGQAPPGRTLHADAGDAHENQASKACTTPKREGPVKPNGDHEVRLKTDTTATFSYRTVGALVSWKLTDKRARALRVLRLFCFSCTDAKREGRQSVRPEQRHEIAMAVPFR